MTERPYFSIGEVLGLLLEEFSDVTISKIRFLESQGLIDPERTSSGYRKFYDGDIERLRYILREQKDNYLPLKVIKERLDGIDHTLPNPPRPNPAGASWAVPSDALNGSASPALADDPVEIVETVTTTVVMVTTDEPFDAGAWTIEPATVPPAHLDRTPATSDPMPVSAPPVLSIVRREPAARVEVQLNATELCQQAGIAPGVLRQLEEYGLLSGRALGTETTYDADGLRVAQLARRFLELGLEVRHLRTWRMNAEKEVSLFEQLVLPLLRQRNPQARHHAAETLAELTELGAQLRVLLVHAALGEYLER